MGHLADGSDSLASQVIPESHWPAMRVLILVANRSAKETSSTDGMQRSVATSPLLAHRAAAIVEPRMRAMEAALLARDFPTFAALTMQDSNQFHATCITGDHRVLTRSGWKSIPRVQAGDEVLSLNIRTFAQEWKPVRRVMSYAVGDRGADDALYRMQGSGMDVIATRDHRMLTARMDYRTQKLQVRTPVGYETVQELLKLSYRVHANVKHTMFAYSGRRHVVSAGTTRQPPHQIVIPGMERVCQWWWRQDEQRGFLQFLGFWLGDGFLGVSHGFVHIRQKKVEARAWLEALLEQVFPRWWYSYHPEKSGDPAMYVYTIRCPPLYEYLRLMAIGPSGYNPRDPAELRSYPHFTAAAGLAETEQQSAYNVPITTDGHVSTWREVHMLAKMQAVREMAEVEAEDEEEEELAEDDVPAVEDVDDGEGETVRIPRAEAVMDEMGDEAVGAALRVAGKTVWWNNGQWIIINGHWYYLKRWLGSQQQIASVYSRLSRQQAIALLDGFCRAGGRWNSVQYEAGEPTGQWHCSNSSFPLIDHLQLIGQLAGARADLSLHTVAGKTSKIGERTVTFTVNHWLLLFTFTQSSKRPGLQTTPLAEPVDVSDDIDARGYYQHEDDGRVYCMSVQDNTNFLTERLCSTRLRSGRDGIKALPVFVGQCMDTYPPIFYLNDTSKAVIHALTRVNEVEGVPVAAYTFDAGPNAVVYCLEERMEELLTLFRQLYGKGESEEWLLDPMQLSKAGGKGEVRQDWLAAAGEVKGSVQVHQVIVSKIGAGATITGHRHSFQ